MNEQSPEDANRALRERLNDCETHLRMAREKLKTSDLLLQEETDDAALGRALRETFGDGVKPSDFSHKDTALRQAVEELKKEMEQHPPTQDELDLCLGQALRDMADGKMTESGDAIGGTWDDLAYVAGAKKILARLEEIVWW
mgnify:CR=1 FL=1